jgi:hypothetical protein
MRIEPGFILDQRAREAPAAVRERAKADVQEHQAVI